LQQRHRGRTRKKGAKKELCWIWTHLLGRSGQKKYDYLILEGDHKSDSKLFIIPYDEVVQFTRGVGAAIEVAAEGAARKHRSATKFVWSWLRSRMWLKQLCGEQSSSVRSLKPFSEQVSSQMRLFL
jgi:hypothetical protein